MYETKFRFAKIVAVLAAAAAVLAACFAFAACGDEPTVETISLNVDSVKLAEGGSYDLSVIMTVSGVDEPVSGIDGSGIERRRGYYRDVDDRQR